jgi:hypothetical protein
MELETFGPFAGPKRRWVISEGTGGCDRFVLGMYSWRHWEFSDGCRGSHAKTPWGAALRWNRFRKEDVMPV